MSLTAKIRTSSGVAVFARNHRHYLDAASSRNEKQPEQFTTFRAAKPWTSAHYANEVHGAIKVYFAAIGGEKEVEYEAIIHRIKLAPQKRDQDTENLLRFSLKETMEEGLWEKGRKRVTTLYVITHCKKISSPFPIMELIKLSDDKLISEDFGYSYSLVYEHRAIPSSDVVISPEEIDPASDIYEGAARQVLVNAYERSAKARKKCIKHYGCSCSVCGFNFEERYGEIGKGFIHVHHLISLAEIDERYKVDPLKDLRPICPNCHAMIHSKKPMFSVEELRKALGN